MRFFGFIVIFFLLPGRGASQDGLVATPHSLILIYNFPDNWFYMEIKGDDLRSTDKKNIFIIDNRLVQVLALHKNKFLAGEMEPVSETDILENYAKWESDYIRNVLKLDIKGQTEVVSTAGGKKALLWSYDMPVTSEETRTDSTVTNPTRKQMFVLRLVKNYVTGIGCPLFDDKGYDENKEFLIGNIDGIVEADGEIDAKELYEKFNSE